MTQGQKNVRTFKGPGLIPLDDSISPVRSDGPYFRFFRYKICFLWSWYCFLCDFLCLYTFLFFHVNFVCFFPDPATSEGCKCS